MAVSDGKLEWIEEGRQPNTIYVASLSYGKDSMAMLEACRQLHLPLDRIVTAEVWATDDISADLPPMVEFKKYADEIIKERYGIEVEHTCTMRKVKPNAERERERERESNRLTMTENATHESSHMNGNYTTSDGINNDKNMSSMGSRANDIRGVMENSNLPLYEKVTYEKLFYHIPQRRAKMKWRGGQILGFPINKGQWCNSNLKKASLRFPNHKSPRRELVYGTQTPTSSVFFSAPERGAKDKYRSVSWYCGR